MRITDVKDRVVVFIKHYFGGLYTRIGENHIFLLGSGLAFSAIMCIIPFVLILIYLLGHLLESSSVTNQIDLFIDTIIPYTQYAAYVKRVIFTRADEVVAYKNLAGYIGAFGLLFAASGLFSSMRTGLNVVFKSPGAKRAYIGKLRDLGMVLLVAIFFVLSTAILPIFEAVKDSAGKVRIFRFFQLSGLEGTAFSIGSFIAIFVLFFALYNLIPHKKPGFKVPAVGALWAALLWTAAKEVFGYYITNVATMKKVYGTYMLFIVVTLWIYYTSVIFLIGAQIAQLYRERRTERKLQREQDIFVGNTSDNQQIDGQILG